MREEKPTTRAGSACRVACGDRHANGNTGQMSELRRVGHDWGEGWIRGVNGVSQVRQNAEAKAVATCVRYGQTTSRHDHAVNLEWLSPILLHRPGGGCS